MQYKKLTIFLLVALVLIFPGGWLKAGNYNDFQTDADSTLYISDLGINLTLLSGAKLEEITVNSGSVSISVESGSTATITSADRKTLSTSYSLANFTCPSSGSSSLTFTATESATLVITPSTGACSAPSGGGGGGGGAPSPVVYTPTNTSININVGAMETSSIDVTLSLSATNASQMMISNLSTFASASWESYKTTKAWTLSSGTGEKTVYIKYKSSSGNVSTVKSDNITLVTSLAAKSVTKSSGGNVSLSDGTVGVDIPANALSGDGIVSITPTASYSALPEGKGLVGAQVYNFQAEIGGSTITTFSDDLTLTFAYTAEQIKNMDENTLAVYYYSENESKWVRLGGEIDLENNKITIKTDHFTKFAIFGDTAYQEGDLVKLTCTGTNKDICTAVYYIGNDGKRYVFPNEKIYFTWFDDYSSVKEISADALAAYQIGGNVNYRPGVKMVKITSDPKVYTVAKGGELKWVKTETVANALYGDNWNKLIDDLPDAFFFNYNIGTAVETSGDYSRDAQKAGAPTININKNL